MFNFNLKLVLIALAIGLMFAACGGNKQQENAEVPEKTTSIQVANQIITNENDIGEGSVAWEQFQAKKMFEEFVFDNNNTLTRYIKTYIFRDNANKERALEQTLDGGFNARIEGENLIIDSENYLGFPCSEYDFNEIKNRLDEKGVIYSTK